MKPETRKAPAARTVGALDFVTNYQEGHVMKSNTAPTELATNHLSQKAWDARMKLEQADMKLAGVRAAHHLLHNNAESDAPMNSEMLYPFLLVIDDALEEIRAAIESADYALMLAHRGDSDDGR